MAPGDLEVFFPLTWEQLPGEALRDLQREAPNGDALPEWLQAGLERYGLPGYLPEMARLELAVQDCSQYSSRIEKHPREETLNPSLRVLHLDWTGLLELIRARLGGDGSQRSREPKPGQAIALLWWDPGSTRVWLEAAGNEDLLVLKVVAEGLDLSSLASEHGLRPSLLKTLIQQARSKGLVLGPASGIRRDQAVVPTDSPWSVSHDRPEIFTLQWHLTQACDLHCRHCYDRSQRRTMSLDEAVRVIGDLASFCDTKHVRGQVTFTGGNPLLYKHFQAVYQAAADQGFILALLGNPTDDATLEKLLEIEPPSLFQVSLEGLEEHNDFIRQPGHFQRTLHFLDRLRDYGIPSQVMLTLTEANLDQVLPLAEVLRDRVDRLTFNRLSMVGEGAALRLPDPERYGRFLEDYLQGARENPVLGLKDNLLNQVLLSRGDKTFGGCTGFGCGAAFNFVTLLPDGEVHACRKLPSPIGNIHEAGLEAIYDSPAAERYRTAPEACKDCRLRPVCRGCLAVTHSFGLDVFTDRDPFCPGLVQV